MAAPTSTCCASASSPRHKPGERGYLIFPYNWCIESAEEPSPDPVGWRAGARRTPYPDGQQPPPADQRLPEGVPRHRHQVPGQLPPLVPPHPPRSPSVTAILSPCRPRPATSDHRAQLTKTEPKLKA